MKPLPPPGDRVRTLFDGHIHVHYGQIYVESTDDVDWSDKHSAGQSNGICGAAIPGLLHLVTGLHTGTTVLTIELHETRPPLDDAWDEIVEVSFRPESTASHLVQWAGEDAWPLDLEPIDYRVRYCADGMDEAHQADVVMDDEPTIDRYLLQFWPAAPEPDAVCRQTGMVAGHLHEHARHLPPPPTAAERAEAARRAELAAQRRSEQRRHEAELREWGGRLPSDAVRRLRGNARALATEDPDLADAVLALTPDRQRELARRTARRAFDRAGLSEIEWIAPALTALARGGDLPPPFEPSGDIRNPHGQAWNRLLSDPDLPSDVVPTPYGPGILRATAAFSSIFTAMHDDPPVAALETLHSAAGTFGERQTELFDEVRREFGLPENTRQPVAAPQSAHQGAVQSRRGALTFDHDRPAHG